MSLKVFFVSPDRKSGRYSEARRLKLASNLDGAHQHTATPSIVSDEKIGAIPGKKFSDVANFLTRRPHNNAEKQGLTQGFQKDPLDGITQQV